MPRTKKWSEVRDKYISRERQAVIAEAVRDAAVSLRALRKARVMTQEQLAESLSMAQGDISKLERRADLYVSTLRRYIEAMGGELKIVASFPDGAEIPVAIAESLDDQDPTVALAPATSR
jgi:transcriptional regulator with XRE-family HTH domain